MQRLFDAHFPTDRDIQSLKSLWHISFGDDYEYIDAFFEKSFDYQNTLCIDDGEKIVSALYLLECGIRKNGVLHKAYYVYAVATHPDYRGQGLMRKLLAEADLIAESRGASYLFLVPAEESLYDMYGRLGYMKGFYCGEELVEKSCDTCELETSPMDYATYSLYHNRFASEDVVFFGEEGFRTFVASSGDDYGYIHIENTGYCVYGNVDDCVTVYELVGDKDALLNKLFCVCGAYAIRLRSRVSQGGTPCGMYKAFGDVPRLESAFMGAYGG